MRNDAMSTRDVHDSRTGLKAIRNNPCLQIVRPPPVPTPGLDNIAPPNKSNPAIRHAKSPSDPEDLMTHAQPTRNMRNQWAADGAYADVDISGPEFDFVRSIKVFNIQYNQRRNHDGGCNRTDATQLGTYEVQGDYRWARSTSTTVPASSDFDPPNGCNDYFYRSVFIDWRDYQGDYGFEEIRY